MQQMLPTTQISSKNDEIDIILLQNAHNWTKDNEWTNGFQ